MAKMTRGTTPTLVFTMPDDYSDYDVVELTFAQGGTNLLVFDKDDMTFVETEDDDGDAVYTIQLKLTQEQVNLFGIGKPAEFNFRLRDGDTIVPSCIGQIQIGRILNDEVMTWG